MKSCSSLYSPYYYIHSLILDNQEIPVVSNIQNIDDKVIKDELEELYTDKSKVFVNILSVNVAEYAEKHFNKSVKKITFSNP